MKVGSRGKILNGREFPAGSYYGYATGVVGMRLFPNPDFDENAARDWDPVRYYNDPDYYLRKDLVRPYRVGMSCAFCHVGPNPVNPPPNPEQPEWKNLSSNVGAQYFWISRIFMWDHKNADESFVHQVFATSRPGALDTSLVSSDNINNPRTMNAIYGLASRLGQAKRWGKETLGGGGLNNKQFNDYVTSGPLTEFFKGPDTVWSPRVLKDGADSVGALGALNRVFINIGLFSEEWLLHFQPLTGGKETTPIEIAVARKNSTYWGATESQTANLALFFLKTTAPHKLMDAPGGGTYLTKDRAKLERGKVVFAENCARCHSSKLPAAAPGVDPGGCSGSNYLQCFNRYWDWTKTEDFKRPMRDIVLAPDFLDDNFLSSELRIPVTLLKTNACSPLATNAIAGNIWDNFSSQTYKELPSVGEIRVYHPVTGEPQMYQMPAGGRGYTRPASLISVWSTAPFFLNNTLGHFEEMPSVAARMRAFDDAIEQLLWPEKREHETLNGHVLPGKIDRTDHVSWLRVPAGYIPESLRPLVDPLEKAKPWLVRDGGIQIGPIPKGAAVNLLANIDLRPDNLGFAERIAYDKKVLAFLFRAKKDLASLPENPSNDEVTKTFENLVDPLLELNKCRDFIVNRGHYFGTSYVEYGDPRAAEPGLSDGDKRALIEFIKTF